MTSTSHSRKSGVELDRQMSPHPKMPRNSDFLFSSTPHKGSVLRPLSLLLPAFPRFAPPQSLSISTCSRCPNQWGCMGACGCSMWPDSNVQIASAWKKKISEQSIRSLSLASFFRKVWIAWCFQTGHFYRGNFVYCWSILWVVCGGELWCYEEECTFLTFIPLP